MTDFSAVDGRTPILVGCAQFVQKTSPKEARSPVELLSDACRRAAEDAAQSEEAGGALLAAIDTLAVVASTTDEPDFENLPVGHLPNPPKSVANALGIAPARGFKSTVGGNTPQMLVNRFAEEIADGKADVVMVAGGEVLASLLKNVLSGVNMNHWGDNNPPIDPANVIGKSDRGVNATEQVHGLNWPTNTYAIFESALSHHLGHSLEDHARYMGALMHPFTKVAAENPYAWFPTERSAEEIATETADNRMVGFPYTKYLNSVIRVDQGAAFLMMSVDKARSLGVAEDRWVFLHGCADANEIWNVTERVNLYSSPAIKIMGEAAYAMAGWSAQDLDFMDIYSCFPSAVQVGCAALGVAPDDPRGLTVTGGLPYFGGAGNAYVMCSIAEMMNRLRAKPGSKGMVTANGWFLTKHAMGLYSTEPYLGTWSREAPNVTQARVDALEHPVLDPKPEGRGTVEGYTVVHSRDEVRMGIVIGTLESGKRFCALVPQDPMLWERMKKEDMVGVSGTVAPGDPTNTFTPDWPA